MSSPFTRQDLLERLAMHDKTVDPCKPTLVFEFILNGHPVREKEAPE